MEFNIHFIDPSKHLLYSRVVRQWRGEQGFMTPRYHGGNFFLVWRGGYNFNNYSHIIMYIIYYTKGINSGLYTEIYAANHGL